MCLNYNDTVYDYSIYVLGSCQGLGKPGEFFAHGAAYVRIELRALFLIWETLIEGIIPLSKELPVASSCGVQGILYRHEVTKRYVLAPQIPEQANV